MQSGRNELNLLTHAINTPLHPSFSGYLQKHGRKQFEDDFASWKIF